MIYFQKALLIVILCAAFLQLTATQNEGKLIEIPGLGSIQGSTTKTAWTKRVIYQYLGIHFAESPSGRLRFKLAVPRNAWTGIFNATQFGRRCPVKGLQFGNLTEDLEDCLHLNVFTPNVTGNAPVLVYIYGGGFYNGSSSTYKPDFLLEKDIVLVVAQHRPGALGFLSTQTSEIPGNMAISDVIVAMEWIKKYISYFGGDPQRVTLSGQSSGAVIVTILMMSPTVQPGLFHQVILQSGSLLGPWTRKIEMIQTARDICVRGNCADCQSVFRINQCLINMNIVDFVDISTGDKLRFTDKYIPIIDDYNHILPDDPEKLLEVSKPYPMIAGVTRHDGSFIVAAAYDQLISGNKSLQDVNPVDFVQTIIHLCKEHTNGAISNMAGKLLFNKHDLDERNYKNLFPGFIDLASILCFKSPVLNTALVNSKNMTRTYLYTFDYEGNPSYFGYGEDTSHYPFKGGAHHSNDYIYLFATFPLNKKDTEMAKQMVDLWTSFVINGKPSSKNFKSWTSINGSGPYAHLNRVSSVGYDFLDEFVVESKKTSSSDSLLKNKTVLFIVVQIALRMF